jgi:hypothetical protein
MFRQCIQCPGHHHHQSDPMVNSNASPVTAGPLLLPLLIPVFLFQMMQLLDQVHSGQQQLLQLWQVKRVRLDQCLQLRMFEQDCEKVITFYLTFFIK